MMKHEVRATWCVWASSPSLVLTLTKSMTGLTVNFAVHEG